jgi:hypothetical protein
MNQYGAICNCQRIPTEIQHASLFIDVTDDFETAAAAASATAFVSVNDDDNDDASDEFVVVVVGSSVDLRVSCHICIFVSIH